MWTRYIVLLSHFRIFIGSWTKKKKKRINQIFILRKKCQDIFISSSISARETTQWNSGCSFANVYPFCCSNTSLRKWLCFVVSTNLMAARSSWCTPLGSHASWGVGADSSYVGSGNPPHTTSFLSHSFSHLDTCPLFFLFVRLCLHWAALCLWLCTEEKKTATYAVFLFCLCLHVSLNKHRPPTLKLCRYYFAWCDFSWWINK